MKQLDIFRKRSAFFKLVTAVKRRKGLALIKRTRRIRRLRSGFEALKGTTKVMKYENEVKLRKVFEAIRK